MANDSSGFRREFVVGVGTVIAAAVAGCSSSGDSPDGDGTNNGPDEGSPPANTDTSPPDTPKTTGEPTSTERDTTTESNEDQEDAMHDYESQLEEDLLNSAEYSWLEFENADSQIPQDGFSEEDFPVMAAAFEETDFYGDDVLTAYILSTFRSPREDVDTDSQHIEILLITDGREFEEWEEGSDIGVGHYEQLTEQILEEDEPALLDFLDEAVQGYSDAAEYLDSEMTQLAGQ